MIAGILKFADLNSDGTHEGQGIGIASAPKRHSSPPRIISTGFKKDMTVESPALRRSTISLQELLGGATVSVGSSRQILVTHLYSSQIVAVKRTRTREGC